MSIETHDPTRLPRDGTPFQQAHRAERQKVEPTDIETAQHGWPLGMPLIRKLEPGLREARSHIAAGIARVLFMVDRSILVLLHGFVKKSQKTPASDLKTAQQRLAGPRRE